jgi:hypothetical protein
MPLLRRPHDRHRVRASEILASSWRYKGENVRPAVLYVDERENAALYGKSDPLVMIAKAGFTISTLLMIPGDEACAMMVSNRVFVMAGFP